MKTKSWHMARPASLSRMTVVSYADWAAGSSRLRGGGYGKSIVRNPSLSGWRLPLKFTLWINGKWGRPMSLEANESIPCFVIDVFPVRGGRIGANLARDRLGQTRRSRRAQPGRWLRREVRSAPAIRTARNPDGTPSRVMSAKYRQHLVTGFLTGRFCPSMGRSLIKPMLFKLVHGGAVA